MSSYIYELTDTVNDSANGTTLRSEIESSIITVAINYIKIGTDIDINFKVNISTNEKNTLDTIVAAHTGIIPDEEKVIHYVEDIPQGGKRVTNRGFKFTATAGQVTDYDFQLTESLFVKGGFAICKGFEFGDEVAMHIVHPLTDTILHSYIKGFPVSPYVDDIGIVDANNSAITETDFNGLKIRLSYTSTGLTDVEIGVGIRGYS